MSSDSILCQHKWLIILVSGIFLLKKMPQSPKWPADVKYTFFQSYVFSMKKKTFFCRKKVVRVVSMNMKKVYCVYKVFQNWYFYIFSILLIKNLKAKNYLPKVLRNDLILQIASSSDHMSITNLRNIILNSL